MKSAQPRPRPTVVKTSFYLDEELLDRAKAAAAADHRSLRAWLVTLIEAALRRVDKGRVA